MARVFDITSAALDLAWKITVPLASIAIVLGMGSERAYSPAECRGKHGRATLVDDGECVRLILDHQGKEAQLKCVVRGTHWKHPISLIVRDEGDFHYWLDPASPVRMIGGRRMNGAIFQTTDNGTVILEVESQPDGSSEVVVSKSFITNRPQPRRLLARLRVTKEGRVTHEESDAEKVTE